MSGINTQVDFLAPPRDHMCDSGHVSLWEKANQMEHSSHLATNSSGGNDSFPLFTPATQGPQGPLGQEAPLETSFFQRANRVISNSLREPTDTCASVFQAANRGGDTFKNIHLHSGQNHLATSNVFDSFDSLHKASLLEKQKIKDSCNAYKTSSISDSASAHPVVKRVPIFKAGRSKASKVPLLPNKAKKRLITSEEEPVKKHAGISSFNHSEISAFKPVITNGTSEIASTPSPSLSTETVDNQNIPPSNKGKTLPKKPKFGKPHPCPDKKIKKEKNSLLMKSGSGEPNREDSDTLRSSQPGEESKSMDNAPTEIIKEEVCVDKDKFDDTGTFGEENESGKEDSFTHTPVQRKSPKKKKNKTQGTKKNLPSILGFKKKKLHGAQINMKKHPESNKGRKKKPSQIMSAGQSSQSEALNDSDKSPSQVIDEEKISESHATQFSKTNTQMIPNKKKKISFNDIKGMKSTFSDAVNIKKKKSLKNCTSTSAMKQQTAEADLPGQMEKETHGSYTDDASHKPSVSEDLTGSTLRSSPLSHDTTESSLDLSQSRTSEMSSCGESERSRERDKYEEESNRITDEEITNLSEGYKESVLHLLNSVDRDTWVQCDRCSKWRKLTHILDPATLPDRWYCTMLPVVWAQVPGSPMWPAMVDVDPDYKRYDWLNSTGTIVTSYHVTFFGDPVTRAWVTCSNLRTFKQHDTYKKIICDGKKNPTRDPLLRRAVEEATHALSMEVGRRRRTYTFVARYKGSIGRNSVDNQSETSEVKTAPLKTFGHKKKKKVSPAVMKPISQEPADTVEMSDNDGNRSQFPKDNEIMDRDKSESRLERQEQSTNESFDKQNLNKNNSEYDQYQTNDKNEEDSRIGGGFMDTMNTDNTEGASEMEFCDKECSYDDQYINIDECHETDKETTTEGNPNSTLKNINVPSKMTKKKNMIKSCTGIKKKMEKMNIINKDNIVSSEYDLNCNEVYESDLQGNEETFNSMHGSDLQDNEDTLASLDGTDLQDNEDTLDSVHGTDLQDIEEANDSVHGTDLKDSQDFFDSMHGTNLQVNEDTFDSLHGTYIQDSEEVIDSLHWTNIQDNEDTLDSVHETDMQDNEDTLDNANGTDMQNNEATDSILGTDLQDDEDTHDDMHDTDLQDNEEAGSHYQEQDENEINYKQSYPDDEQHDTVSTPEHNNTENEIEKYCFEGGTSEFVEHYDQDGNDEYDEQDDMENNYEQDTSIYEGQGNEDSCEDNKYTFTKNTEYDDGQDDEGSYEAPSNCDYEDDDFEDNEGQDIDDSGAAQNLDDGDNEDGYKHQNECHYEEQDPNDDGENGCNYEDQLIDDNKEHILGDYDDGNGSEHKEFNDNYKYDKTDEYESHDYEEQPNDSSKD
ncbi:uncharacterized protein LOC127009656 isoform X2 [Eriocheir sinensis]|uniref:uncharacterized protein LOC127009656 isoform X2 n=1 Tax=Eriocheir sinensis TaxID=95602 RepID=UPI0021C85DB7|nr:uncharacterized protein LOC127009656 isoform X2 [Eriocheir sinensis]